MIWRKNSRIEMLIEFKVSYGNSLRAVMGILAKIQTGYGY